jgi:hypothetical protein
MNGTYANGSAIPGAVVCQYDAVSCATGQAGPTPNWYFCEPDCA